MTRPESKTAVIYCRVSSAKQTTRGDGLGSQETRCREYAAFRGFTVAEVFKDNISGAVSDRPGMNAMIDFLRKNRKEGIIVLIDDISRLARDIITHRRCRDTIMRANAVVMSPTQVFVDNDPDQEFVEGINALQAEHHRKKNAKQTSDRMKARMMGGHWVFAAPWGYKYDRAPGGGRMLKPSEPAASIVRECLEGYASDRFTTPSEVARFLAGHAEFPRTRHGVVLVERATVLLKQALYAGCVEHLPWGVNLRKGQHQGLISLETYNRIQEKLFGKARAPYRVDLSPDFPLRGHVLCDDCGHALTACWSKGRDRMHPYYLCRQRGCESQNKSIARKKIDSAFEGVMKSLVPARELFDLAGATFRDSWNGQLAKAGQRRSDLKKDAQDIEKKISVMLDRIVDAESRTVIAALEKRVDELETQKLIIEENIARCGSPIRDYDETFRTAMGFLANPWNLYTSERMEDKRAALKLTFPNQLRYHREKGFRTPETSLPFKMLGSDFSNLAVMARPERFERPTLRFVV